MSVQRIVAVGLLTEQDLAALGTSFSRAYPIQDTPCFNQLLQDIDEADREFRTGRSAAEARAEPVLRPVLGGGRR